MSAEYEHPAIKNNVAEQRYEVRIDGELAVLEYDLKGQHITFIHTGVPEALEGHGLANKLAKTALDEARDAHLSVTASCPFVASYIKRHPEYMSLLSASEQARIQRMRD